MEIDYEKIEQAIAGDRRALVDAFSWCASEQGFYYWYNQCAGASPLDIEALKAMRKAPSIQVGEVYTDNFGTDRKCIFIDGDIAYMRRTDRTDVFAWDVNTGKSMSLGPCRDINLTPKPVVESKTGTVTFTDGVADFSTWKEV